MISSFVNIFHRGTVVPLTLSQNIVSIKSSYRQPINKLPSYSRALLRVRPPVRTHEVHRTKSVIAPI